MAPIFRNFISVVRRYKMAVVLNILGLSVAFAAFMVIMIQLNYDFGFDKFHKDYDKIFRLEMAPKSSTPYAVISRPLAERFFESSPAIVAGAITNPLGNLWGGDPFFHVETNGVRKSFKEKALQVSPELTDVFTFDIVEGAADALKTPGHVMIPLSMARKFFGNESAVGQQLFYESDNQTVGAVYRDFPTNTVLSNYIYVSFPENENKDNWGAFNYHVYIRVNEVSNVSMLVDNFFRNFDIQAAIGDMFNWAESGLTIQLTALPDIHFAADIQYDTSQKASRQMLMILFAIALVIIAIAAINFTNFSTALTPKRIKNINTQRVLGARQRTLRFALVFEAVAVSVLSYIVALALIALFNGSSLAGLVDADLSFSAQPLIIGGTALVALLAGLLAGLYPARYMTSFAPALVLKGSFGLSPKGRKLRNTLIGIQFIASFALIIGASFMFLQNNYMQQSALGYDKDALITVDIRQIQKNRDAFTNQLKSFSGIEGVTYSQFLLSSSDSYMKWGRPYKGDRITFQVLPVHHSFLEVMGIEIDEGRHFREEDTHTQQGAWIFNESSKKQYNMELNSVLNDFSSDKKTGGEVIGFIKTQTGYTGRY